MYIQNYEKKIKVYSLGKEDNIKEEKVVPKKVSQISLDDIRTAIIPPSVSIYTVKRIKVFKNESK